MADDGTGLEVSLDGLSIGWKEIVGEIEARSGQSVLSPTGPRLSIRHRLGTYTYLAALGSVEALAPALFWLEFLDHSESTGISVMLVSLIANAVESAAVLERRGHRGSWSRFGWILVVTCLGIYVWGAAFADNRLIIQ